MDDRQFGGADVGGNPFGSASPILVLGIFIFISPMVLDIFNIHIPLRFLVYIFGGILMAAGVVHSIFQ